MSVDFNWFPGHMNKTLKEIEKRIPIVDLVIEIVDARAPYSSQNQTFKKILDSKPVLCVISKADLADPNITKQWINFFESNNKHVFVIDPNNKNIVKDLINAIDHATKEKQDKDRAKGFVNSLINVLVIGIPNVGKSTFINKIIRDKSVKVGNKPGVTRGIQTLSLNKRITLMDTPGVLPAKLENELTATNICGIYSIKEDVYPRERVASRLMKYVYNNYNNLIEKKYHLVSSLKRPIETIDSYYLFEMIATSLGWIIANEIPDIERVMQAFIRDLANGKIGKISFERPSDIIIEEPQDSIMNEKIEDITTQW
ncbi:ribosomal biogenesis GTPase [Williamsoniiplasma somnilux]|uniref:Ribosome biogenesis GTPase A n=1 Tax=Williamsoniiplasma somnilux TaxID=215578 RepID=A0A2K8NYK6_9MOLU|nr:ribosome biogenesis GTPase YlqF [Williamsoniiplasma somnilux]ATZ18824.1 ribosomal biogenesis GTPase [Williamsoniiplasma somnilux]